jgi:hypothetical protein
MDKKLKMAVLEHLKGLMDSKMSEDIPSKMKIDEIHKVAPPDTLAVGEDEKGNPMGMGVHEEETEAMGHLPDLHELHSGTDKAMEKVESKPHLEVPLDEKKHPLFANAVPADKEDTNHSFIANLKRAKKLKE